MTQVARAPVIMLRFCFSTRVFTHVPAWVRVCHAFTLGALCAVSGVVHAQNVAQAAARPNIVLLVADDMGWGDMSSQGHPVIRTPNLDRMAAEGQRWTDFYVSSPICSPSRGAMLTGRVETRTGLYGVRNPVTIENDPYGFPATETTVAGVLRNAGYETALFGKWHLGDSPRAYPTRHGFDRWWGTPLSNDGYFVKMSEYRQRLEKGEPASKIYVDYVRDSRNAFGAPRTEMWDIPLIASERVRSSTGVPQRYADEQIERPINQYTYNKRLTDQVVEFVGRKHQQPFFAWVGYEKPHLPHFPGPEFAGRSRGGALGDVMAELDHSVGRVMDALHQSGNDRDTLVVFVSDNGPWYWFEDMSGSASMLREGKLSTYEGGPRVPALFWWPGTIKPAIVDGIGSTYDFMPTFAALAGTQPPAVTIDGLDLTPALRGMTASPRQSMPYYFNGALRAWREGDWKLHLYETTSRLGGKSGKLEKPALYHLGRDPGEKFDQAAKEPVVVERLLKAAEDFDRSIVKAPSVFDRVALEAERK
jgi:arylsulfatase A-like enzyme